MLNQSHFSSNFLFQRALLVLIESFYLFFSRHPALFYALFLFFGAAFWQGNNAMLFIGLFYFSLLFIKKPKETLFGCLLFFSPLLFRSPPQASTSIEGNFRVHITKITQAKTFTTPCYMYEAKVTFQEESPQSCFFKIPLSKERLIGNYDYFVDGKLMVREKKKAIFKPKPHTWHRGEKNFSLAELRFQAKSAIKTYLEKKMPQKRAPLLLAGLLTGEFSDPLLFWSFNNVGLSHLLCISGFHFGLVAFFCHLFLRLVLSPKKASVVLLLLLGAYFLFIGDNPAVERSWLMISTYLIGQIVEGRARGLNSIGAALAIALFDLSVLHSLGFQFSYAATFAILLFTPSLSNLFEQFFPKKKIVPLLSLPRRKQYQYAFTSFLRKALALSIGVHCIVLPLSLYHFHRFPLLSFLYNFFYPFLITISLYLLFLSFIFPFLHTLNALYTELLLEGIEWKIPFAPVWHVESFPLPLLISILSLFFTAGILAYYYLDCKKRHYAPFFWL